MRYDYDVVVIGGGAAGLVVATGAVGMGVKTALIEKDKLGGDCTWYGCIPSKTLLKSASVYSLIRRHKDFGLMASDEIKYDTSGAMAHVRDVINKISTHHPPEVFEKRGIKVLFGNTKFINNKTIELDGRKITSRRFILCTGSHPMVLPIEGLMEIDYLTNENIFDLTTLPKSLIVLGAGPIGVELSQAFAKLGVKVSIVEMFDRVLFREDEEAAGVLAKELKKDAINLYTGKKAVKVNKKGNSVEVILKDKNNTTSEVEAERILVAVGREPNVNGLDLERAGIEYDKKGIKVDAYLKTTANGIYACGDIASPYQFSHIAEYQAVAVVQNALFPFKKKMDYSVVPWCTFTTPELARAGLTEQQAREKYKDIKIYKAKYAENDRAVTDLEETGFAKVVCDKKGNILGAHIVGANAGEVIHEFVLAMSAKLNIGKISGAIHIYPTLAQVAKRASDQYYTEMLGSKGFKLFTKIMLKLFFK